MDYQDAAKAVGAHLTSQDASMRRHAASLASSYATHPKVFEVLHRMARQEPEEGVRVECLAALDLIIAAWVDTDSEEPAQERLTRPPTENQFQRAKRALVTVARGKKEPVSCRAAAVRSLGRVSDEPGVRDVIRQVHALGTTEALVASLAAMALRRDRGWEKEVSPCLSHPDRQVRLEAARAARAIWVTDCAAELSKLCEPSDPEILVEALPAFARIGDIREVEEAITRASDIRDPVVKEAVEEAEEYLRDRVDSGGKILTQPEDEVESWQEGEGDREWQEGWEGEAFTDNDSPPEEDDLWSRRDEFWEDDEREEDPDDDDDDDDNNWWRMGEEDE